MDSGVPNQRFLSGLIFGAAGIQVDLRADGSFLFDESLEEFLALSRLILEC